MAQDVPVEMIDEIVAAESLGQLRSNSVMVGLVNRNFENIVAQRGDTVNVTFRAALALVQFDHTEATGAELAIAFTNKGSTRVQLVLDQHWGAAFPVEDFYESLSTPDLIGGWTSDAGILLSDKVDATLNEEITASSTTCLPSSATMA